MIVARSSGPAASASARHPGLPASADELDKQRDTVEKKLEKKSDHVDESSAELKAATDALLAARADLADAQSHLAQTEGELAAGGNLLEHVLNALPVEAEATHIPESVTVSVEGLEAGASVLAKDITLPKGTTLAVDGDAVVLQVLAAQAEEPSEESAEGDEAAEA